MMLGHSDYRDFSIQNGDASILIIDGSPVSFLTPDSYWLSDDGVEYSSFDILCISFNNFTQDMDAEYDSGTITPADISEAPWDAIKGVKSGTLYNGEYYDDVALEKIGKPFAYFHITNNTATGYDVATIGTYFVKASTTKTITLTPSKEGYETEITVTPDLSVTIDVDGTAVFVIAPNSGYYFDKTDTCFVTLGETKIDGTATTSGGYTFSFNYDDISDGDNWTLEYTITEGEPPKPEKTRKNFYTVYAPTSDNMDTINNAVFVSSEGTVNVLAKIISYKRFFCDIAIDSLKRLKAGGYDFGVDAPYVSQLKQIVDLGSIRIDEKYHSLLDYTPYTRLVLYLPFIGFVDLNTKEVMNQILHLQYVVDVLSGRCLAMVYADIVSPETLITQFGGTIAADEPLSQGYSNYSGTYELMTTNQLGELTPFLLIHRANVLEDTTQPPIDGLPSEETKKVSDCHGYVRFKFILASGMTATEAEKQQIEHLLTTGVLVD